MDPAVAAPTSMTAAENQLAQLLPAIEIEGMPLHVFLEMISSLGNVPIQLGSRRAADGSHISRGTGVGSAGADLLGGNFARGPSTVAFGLPDKVRWYGPLAGGGESVQSTIPLRTW